MNDTRPSMARWPLSFKITSTRQAWSHALYRGPQGQTVRVMYAKTKDSSEALAKELLHEKIVGFDMEWNPFVRKDDQSVTLQQRVGMIQVAWEDVIALFHIGLHNGKTPDELVAKSLRKLIEDPNIIKAGVNINHADFARLRKWFGVKPKSAFELSHLHNLLTYDGHDLPKCTTKITSLTKLVDLYLGVPLLKGSARLSCWDTYLSLEQKNYAAADAYACFTLYHCLNAKRTAMHRPPPLPISAETYSEFGLSTELRLRSGNSNDGMLTVTDFYNGVASYQRPVTHPIDSECTAIAGTRKRKRKRKRQSAEGDQGPAGKKQLPSTAIY